MIKGSLGSRMGRSSRRIRARLSGSAKRMPTMLYYLLTSLADESPPLNVFRYLTTRTGMAILTALLFIFLFGPRIISLLKVKQGAASRSAPTGRSAISSRSRARPPWAG